MTTCGIKITEELDNAYFRKYCEAEEHNDKENSRAIFNGDYVRVTNESVFLTVY